MYTRVNDDVKVYCIYIKLQIIIIIDDFLLQTCYVLLLLCVTLAHIKRTVNGEASDGVTREKKVEHPKLLSS